MLPPPRIASEIILTKEHLSHIGSVVIESTYCEIFLEELIWHLLGSDRDRGKTVTLGMSITTRLEVLKQLGTPQLSAEQSSALNVLLQGISEAITDRNNVVHGYWSTSVPNFLAVISKGPENFPPANAKRRRKKGAAAEFSAEDIRAVAARFSDLTTELRDFAYSAWPALP